MKDVTESLGFTDLADLIVTKMSSDPDVINAVAVKSTNKESLTQKYQKDVLETVKSLRKDNLELKKKFAEAQLVFTKQLSKMQADNERMAKIVQGLNNKFEYVNETVEKLKDQNRAKFEKFKVEKIYQVPRGVAMTSSFASKADAPSSSDETLPGTCSKASR